MTRGKLLLSVLLISSGFAVLPVQSIAQEGSSATCDHAGIYQFEGINRRASENKPSLIRQFSALGLAAKLGECNVKVTCHASRPGASALSNMQTACEGVAGQMLRAVIDSGQRRNPLALAAVRAWRDSWPVVAIPAPSQSLAGKVHIELR